MKPSDLEKIAKIHEQYKAVAKDCSDLYVLIDYLSEKSDKTLHVCLNQSNHTDIPPIRIRKMNDIAETLMGVIKEAREGMQSAHVDLTNQESIEVLRLILKFKSTQKSLLAEELKELGVDII